MDSKQSSTHNMEDEPIKIIASSGKSSEKRD